MRLKQTLNVNAAASQFSKGGHAGGGGGGGLSFTNDGRTVVSTMATNTAKTTAQEIAMAFFLC
jgi:hypothetical protein